MNWISDVQDALRSLDLSIKSLRKFAFLIGFLLLIISAWMIVSNPSSVFAYSLGAIAFLLLLAGLVAPGRLSILYMIWMGIAIAIGWWISRFLLILFFYAVITPVGMFARFAGKRFMDVDMNDKKRTYWVDRKSGDTTNYEKMY